MEIEENIERISRTKSDLAYNIVSSLMDRFEYDLQQRICFIIAGDIVFNMANDVPRPERSTGKMVKGSDMDIVVIVDGQFPERQRGRLDEEIYKEKYSLLLNPYIKEEIDYMVKDISRVKEQVKFDTFKHMVACKILHEGTLLFGSDDIFHTIKKLLREYGINEKIDAMERSAREFRLRAENCLLHEDLEKIKEDSYHLFYPTEESEEFE
ncbi:MAG: nucleotidyltransferase domain-containing protein [Desulfobacteraceae bacterium]|nr:MAG: nucleotidyltransferase domain-containing protein [Desulfobacteraceae bacterium]